MNQTWLIWARSAFQIVTCARLTPFNLVTPINSASMETPKHCSSGLGGPVQGHWLTLFAQHPSHYPVPISKSDHTHVKAHYATFHTCECTSGEPGNARRGCCAKICNSSATGKFCFPCLNESGGRAGMLSESATEPIFLLHKSSHASLPLNRRSACRLNGSQTESVASTVSLSWWNYILCLSSVLFWLRWCQRPQPNRAPAPFP